MAAAASAAAPIIAEAAKTGGEIIKEGTKTIFGALGNLMNEKYEQRKREQQALIEQEKLVLENTLKAKLAALQNELDEKLMKAKSDEERKTIFMKFENDREMFLLKWNKDYEIKKEEWARADRLIERDWKMQDIEVADRAKARDQLRHLIYTAPNPEVKAIYAQTLAQTFGKGEKMETIDELLEYEGGQPSIPPKIQDATYTQEYISEIESSKRESPAEPFVVYSAMPQGQDAFKGGDKATFTSSPTLEETLFSLDEREMKKFFGKKKNNLKVFN